MGYGRLKDKVAFITGRRLGYRQSHRQEFRG